MLLSSNLFKHPNRIIPSITLKERGNEFVLQNWSPTRVGSSFQYYYVCQFFIFYFYFLCIQHVLMTLLTTTFCRGLNPARERAFSYPQSRAAIVQLVGTARTQRNAVLDI